MNDDDIMDWYDGERGEHNVVLPTTMSPFPTCSRCDHYKWRQMLSSSAKRVTADDEWSKFEPRFRRITNAP